jgi:aspartate aminotransferase
MSNFDGVGLIYLYRWGGTVVIKDLLARRVQGIEMSGIRKMFELAGSDSVNMGLGEPDFQPAPHIIEAAYEASKAGHNGYGPSLGLPALREALADRISEKWRGQVASDNIIVTSSATQGLMAINQTFVDRGDEVLVPDPGFVLYGSQAKICGGTPVPYGLTAETGFLPNPEEINEKITSATKLLIVNSPSNPTGGCIPEQDVRAIAEIAEDKGVMVVADEVYDTMTFDDDHHSFLSHMDNVLWVNSFSKTYAMTGWRLGCIATTGAHVKAIETMHYYTVACPPTPTQYAGVAALTGPQDQVVEMTATFKQRRDVISKRIQNIDGLTMKRPSGAFYAFPHYDHDVLSQDLSLTLAKEGLICSPGSAFGALGENHLRFSYACSNEQIEKGMDILERVLSDIPERSA